MIQRKPMTSLYEAVRRFLEHPHDETGRSDFDYHLSLYEEAPPSGGGGGEWRPHPLCLHPPATAQSLALAKRIIEGQAELCGATLKIEVDRRPQALEMVEHLAKELQLDHVYCVNLVRAVSSEDVRLWVEHKVEPAGTGGGGGHGHGGGCDEYAMPGGGAGGDRGSMMMVPLHDDLLASARFLFFIEKRAALNTLLELVQARIGMGLSEAKQHAVMVATDALIGQGLPSLLMQRIAAISREVKCRGRTPLEVEFEVERQKAADCLFFLFYQTQILPRELLPLPGAGGVGAGAGALVPASSSSGGAAPGGPVTLLGLIKQLTEELKRKFSVVAPGEEQHKSKEERALFKALATLLMTLVTSLITLDGLLPRPGSSPAGERRNALLTYIKEDGKLDEARDKRMEHDKQHKAANAAHATLPPETQAKLTTLEHAFKDAQTQVTQTFAHLRHELENGWANSGIQAVVLLAWGAFLEDDELAERLASVKEQRFLAQMRGDLLSRAMGQGVFGFVEGALVACWKRPQQEDIQMFFLDVVVELLSVYLKEQHEIVRSLPGYGRVRPSAPPPTHAGAGGGGGAGAGADGSGPDAAAQRKMAVESLISLLVCLSDSHGGLAERLLWTRGENGAEPEPVQFVKDVSELVKNDQQLRAAWVQLLAAMATAPNEECKAATMDFLVDFSPFVSAQTRRSMDVLTYVLEDSILRAEQKQPLQRDLLLGVFLLIERVTCPALARDADLAFVRHVLPLLYSLLNYSLQADLKGALFKALAPFAALPDGMARQLWEHLEQQAILPARGKRETLRYDLEEVEAKSGSYPITEGFVTLLVALLRGDVPYDLGETTGRSDGVLGIQPYLDYLIDDVLLPLRTRPFADPAQKWKIVAKGLEALLLVGERYPLVADDDRLRNLGLSSIQRRLANEEVNRDVDAVGPCPSAGFSLLLRLLGSSSTDPSRGTLLPLVMDVIAGAELSPPVSGGAASSMAIQQQHYGQRTPGFGLLGGAQHPSLGGGKQETLPPGPWRLEHKTKLREAKAWDDAVLVFDDDPARGFTYRGYGGGGDEVGWQEEAVKVGLELLNNVLVKDQEMKRLHAEMPDHPFFRDVRVAAVHEILARGLGGGARPHASSQGRRGSSSTLISQGRVLPLIAEYTAYDHHPSLRLHASLCLRSIMGRVAQPQDLLEMFRGVGGPSSEEGLEQRQRALDAILKTLSHPGDPLDLEGSTLLEFGDLPRALNLLAKIQPTAAQVDRLVHFLVLDVLLKNLLPYRATVSHLFLGYLVDEQPGPLRLPADPGAHGLFGLQLIVRNLSAPSFLTLAPLLAEKSFELVYRLVYAQKTVDATLAYLQRDDVDFFSREFALLSRRPFPTPPRAPPTDGTSNRRRSSLTAAHQQQAAQVRFFREQVAYASSLHVWAWLLKSIAVAIFYQQSDKSKVRRLLEMLLTAPVLVRGGPQQQGPDGSGDQDFETRALVFTELLQRIQLAHQRDVPQPPSEELRGVADRCSIPLPGPPEVRLFRGIVEDSFMNAVRTRLGTLGGGGVGGIGAAPGGEGRPGGAGAALGGMGGGGVGGVTSPAQAAGRPLMGGAPQATAWLLQEASTYCMHYNHFILRQAAEYHWCEAWKRCGEAILKECREVLLRPSFEPGNGGSSPTELQILLTLMAQTVGKLCQQPFGDIKALEHLSVVVMAAVDVLWRYAMSRPGGIPDTVMSVDEGQRVLELVLEALLRKSPNAATAVADAGQLAQQKYRVQCYCALILFLRATSLLPLPEPVVGGERDGTAPLLLTAGMGGGSSSSSSAATPWLSGSRLLAARKEKNAEVLTSPRFFRELVEGLAKDATFAPSFGKTRSRYQACAASCLGVIIETLFSASAPADASMDGSLPLLPLGVAPGMGKYDTAIREVLEKFPRLLEDLDPQFCVEKGAGGPGELHGSFLSPSGAAAASSSSRFSVFSPHQDMSPMDVGGRNPEALLEERPWDATFRFYVDMLVQVAQDARGAKMLLDRGLVDKLSRTRFLVALEDGDMPSLDAGRKEDLMDNMGCVLRLLQVMLAKLALNADLRPQVQEFLRRHTRVLLQFIEARQGDLRGLDEVGVVVGLLAHSVGVKGSGVLGHAAPASLAPAQDEYRRLVNDLFERFAVELLPPYAVRFQVRTQGWWVALEDVDDHVVPCEPPQGVNKQYAWRVSDAFKLLVSQTLLLHVTTYIRRRLRKAKYPNIRVETVLVSLRMCLSFLVAQGDGPAPPVPSLREVSRGGYPAVVVAKEGGRAPWDYDYLRTSLRRLFDNLLDILYHIVQYRSDLDPIFPKEAVHSELLKALQGHEEWLEKQTHVGAWPYLKMNLDAIQDKLRV